MYSTLNHLPDCCTETNTAPSEVFLRNKSNYLHRSKITLFDIQTLVEAHEVSCATMKTQNLQLLFHS